jgi:hypothetical protein
MEQNFQIIKKIKYNLFNKVNEKNKYMIMLDKIKEHALSIRPTFIGACKNGDIEEVQKYIDEGVDCTYNDNYAIRYASLNGYLEINCSFITRTWSRLH